MRPTIELVAVCFALSVNVVNVVITLLLRNELHWHEGRDDDGLILKRKEKTRHGPVGTTDVHT